ncbi:hypothetical protein [Pseudonocardia endophytica]|uniref:hypothetical protein n=1 Tax=Pseudonocardia endophytica TaxID=401976 RepID=UPI001043742F|nr:hypothetical protein [Pseudonocardia endophytica]
MGGAEHGGLLDHAGRRGGAEQVGLVALVGGELPVGACPPGALLPFLASQWVLGAVRDRSEGVERPPGRVVRQLGAQLVAAGVRGVGAVLQELAVLLVGDRGGDEIGGAVQVRGEAAQQAAGDAVVQHLGRGLGVGEAAVVAGGVGEDLVRVVAGQLGGAQQPLQRRHRLVGGKPRPLVGG